MDVALDVFAGTPGTNSRWDGVVVVVDDDDVLAIAVEPVLGLVLTSLPIIIHVVVRLLLFAMIVWDIWGSCFVLQQ